MSNLPSSTNPIAVAYEGNDSPPSASGASDGTDNQQVARGVAGVAGGVAGAATNESSSSSSSSSPGNNCETARALQFAAAQPTTGNIDGTPIASNVTEDVIEHQILGQVPVSRALEYNNAGVFEQLRLEQQMKDERYKQMHGSMGKAETSPASSSESSTASPSQSTP